MKSSDHSKCISNGFVCFSLAVGASALDLRWQGKTLMRGLDISTLLVAIQNRVLRRVSMTHCSGEAAERQFPGDNGAGSDVTFVRDEVLISQIKKILHGGAQPGKWPWGGLLP